jgi:hypothetical protein
MMSNYASSVYVSSDPSTYMVHIRFTFKTGCDISGIKALADCRTANLD